MQPNATRQARPIARARDERRLLAVACRRLEKLRGVGGLGAAHGWDAALHPRSQLGSAPLPCPSAAVPRTLLRRPASRQRWYHSQTPPPALGEILLPGSVFVLSPPALTSTR